MKFMDEADPGTQTAITVIGTCLLIALIITVGDFINRPGGPIGVECAREGATPKAQAKCVERAKEEAAPAR